MNPTLVFNSRALWLAALGLILILLPRAIPSRWLGYPALFIALLLPVKVRPPLQVTIMDVGQGLAVVVQTPHYNLVYDTGPAYGEAFDAGSGILLPYLRRQGITHLDKLIVSHNDKDHAGGLTGLVDSIAIRQLLWGEPARDGQAALPDPGVSCHDFPAWQWDEVRFQFLNWPGGKRSNANNQSCVLLLEYGEQRILLPGDIEDGVEQLLLQAGELPAKLSLLVAAHHGSRTSSSTAFVNWVRPKWVVYSAGYRNQHGHPHPLVVERFNRVGSHALNTAESGALEFTWTGDGPGHLNDYRLHQQRYWHQ